VKLAGFIVGAVVAAVGVTAFNTWRHVSDDDRLTRYLADHCLPFATGGDAPFDDLGRAPGVYDDFQSRDDLRDGGVRLLEGNRFAAQWGYLDNEGPNNDQVLRFCGVKATYAENTVSGFEVEPDGFVGRYSDVITAFGLLQPEEDTLTTGPRTFGWFETEAEGLRVIMTASPGLVSGFIVVSRPSN